MPPIRSISTLRPKNRTITTFPGTGIGSGLGITALRGDMAGGTIHITPTFIMTRGTIRIDGTTLDRTIRGTIPPITGTGIPTITTIDTLSSSIMMGGFPAHANRDIGGQGPHVEIKSSAGTVRGQVLRLCSPREAERPVDAMQATLLSHHQAGRRRVKQDGVSPVDRQVRDRAVVKPRWEGGDRPVGRVPLQPGLLLHRAVQTAAERVPEDRVQVEVHAEGIITRHSQRSPVKHIVWTLERFDVWIRDRV